MPARPTWKGYLKISLVNIPIKVFPATDAGATLSFNQLHGECQTRIQQKRWCPKCEREVPNTDIVKGFEFEKGRYVVVDEEDVEKVRVDSTRVINLEKFTDDTAIDPIYLERPYYLAPDGPVAREAFAVIREGMKGKAGIGKVALYGREYLVKVQPREKGLVMYTLRHANEIRSMDAIDELSDASLQEHYARLEYANANFGRKSNTPGWMTDMGRTWILFGTIFAVTCRIWMLMVTHAAFDLTALAIIYWDVESKVAHLVFK